ncbi:MAG: hypothetical protein V7707_07445 [Motiliproteus sp.]
MTALLFISPFYIYNVFNKETPIAKLEFTTTSYKNHTAYLSSGELCSTKEFKIFGDQAQIDASFIKPKGWAVAMGFESKYRLDRLSGRYTSTKEQNKMPKHSYNLSSEIFFDIFSNQKLNGESSLLIDSQYGSSIYIDIDPKLTYIIYRTEDALIAKSKQRPSMKFGKDGVLTIEINNACGTPEGIFSMLAKEVNNIAVMFIH